LFHYLDDMDSKMECTRALLERDQTPGNFTSFSHALERVMLRKAIYLTPAPAPVSNPVAVHPTPVVATPVAAPPIAALPIAAPQAPVHTAPRPAPARPVEPVLKPDSLFGAKLLEALRPEK
jgi:hypothetical protein